MSLNHVDSVPKALPAWLSIATFKAETTLSEKVNRVANYLVFVAGLYSVFSYVTRKPALPYIACISLGLIARKIIAIAIGYIAYPAAFFSLKGENPDLIQHENQNIRLLENEKFIIKKISLYKSGTRYDATLVTHPNTIENGKWHVHAFGNASTVEECLWLCSQENLCNNCNTLMINGPSVSKSGGWPTRYQLGAGFEAGISFLEREVKATHIIMGGMSLGGGMMGEAILNHDFTEGLKKNIRYLSLTDRSFNRLSDIVAAIITQIAGRMGRIIKPLFYLLGIELDGIEAARKLSKLGIQQIIIQHSSKDATLSDDVIPDRVSLAHAVRQDPNIRHKFFIESPNLKHNDFHPQNIRDTLDSKLQEFLKS